MRQTANHLLLSKALTKIRRVNMNLLTDGLIEVIRARIIKIYGPLDQPQPQHFRVKIQIALRIRGDRGHMVNTEDRRLHNCPSRYLHWPSIFSFSDSRLPEQGRGAPRISSQAILMLNPSTIA